MAIKLNRSGSEHAESLVKKGRVVVARPQHPLSVAAPRLGHGPGAGEHRARRPQRPGSPHSPRSMPTW